jgi:WXG100 family type VII secretion target
MHGTSYLRQGRPLPLRDGLPGVDADRTLGRTSDRGARAISTTGGPSCVAEVRATIDGLQALSRSIQRNTDDLNRLTSDIDRTVGSTIWTGQAATRFSGLWAEQKRNLTNMAAMLQEVRGEVDERTRRLEVFEA